MKKLLQPLLMSLKKIKFISTVNRPYPPFYLSLMTRGYSSEKIFYNFFKIHYSIQDIRIINGVWCYPEYHMVDFRDLIFNKLLENKKYFQELKSETIRREKKLTLAFKKDLKTFSRVYMEYMPTLAIYFIMDDVLEATVKNILLSKISVKKVNELMPLLTTPLLDNLDKKSKLFLLNNKNPKEFIKKYGWFNSRYGLINTYQLEKAQELLKELKRENYLNKNLVLKKKIKRAIKEAKKIIGSKQAHLIDVMQFFIYYRTHRTDIMNMAAYYFAPQINGIAQKLGLSYNDCLFCSVSELLKNKIPSLATIKNRQKGFSFVVKSGRQTILVNKQHQKLLKEISLKKIDNSAEIMGRTAYPGKVNGVVRIIKDLKDLSRLKNGEILVASMTTPDMISAMKKASAFITDEGGITCHAAIIARELKKPCVIGTKLATKVLKDGDSVSVDANRGIIKVIVK